MHSSHTNVLLLQQLLQQADNWHLTMKADVSAMENRCRREGGGEEGGGGGGTRARWKKGKERERGQGGCVKLRGSWSGRKCVKLS